MRWLAEHAYYWPAEWSTEGDPTAREAHEQLTWAANECHTYLELLKTSETDPEGTENT